MVTGVQTCALPIWLEGRRDALDDYSPAGHEAADDLRRSTLRELDGVPAADEVDRVTVAVMRERLGVEQELADAGEELRDLNVIESPVQQVRDLFDLMPTASTEDWEAVASALRDVPRALEGHLASLAAARRRGLHPPARQVRAVIGQCRDQAEATSSSFTTLVAGAEIGRAHV